MKKLLGTLSAIAALMTAIAFVGCKQPSNEEDETMTIQLVFDDFTADKVVVQYGDENNPDETNSGDVEATVASDKKSATFAAKKSFTNDWNYSQIISVKFYLNNTEISAVLADSGGAYWEFEEGGNKVITYKKKQDESMTLRLVFEDFVASSVKITYGHDNDETTTDGEVSSDGKTATASLSNKYMNATNWMEVKKIIVKDKAGEDVDAECTESNRWFEFKADGTQEFTYKLADNSPESLPYEADYDGTGSLKKILTAATFADKDISKLTVVFSEITLPEGTDSDKGWITLSCDGTWGNNSKWELEAKPFSAEDKTYTCNIPGDEEQEDNTYATNFIKAVKENGLYIAGTDGFTCKIKVSVTETE